MDNGRAADAADDSRAARADLEDGEVFEEAIQPPPTPILAVEQQSGEGFSAEAKEVVVDDRSLDSQVSDVFGVNGKFRDVEVDGFGGLNDSKVNSNVEESGEIVDDVVESERSVDNGGDSGMSESFVNLDSFDEPRDVLEVKPEADEIDEVVDAIVEAIGEAGLEVLVQEHDDNVELSGGEESDGLQVLNDEPVELVHSEVFKNGEPVELVHDEVFKNADDAEVSDVSALNGSQDTLDLSEDKMEIEPETEQPRSFLAQSVVSSDRGSEVKTSEEIGSHVVSGNKDGVDDQLEVPSLKDRFEITEEPQEQSIVVEDFGESSSTDGDDGVVSSSSAPVPTKVNESSGGPSLPSRPAGLGSSVPLLEPTARSVQQSRANGAAAQRSAQVLDELSSEDAEENDETREKLQMIRVKFLRLARRLGQTPHNVVVAQVLYRLGLAEQLRKNTSRPGVFSFDRASIVAEQLEAAGQEPLDFSCTIMVIGKTGVGKSSTINSIIDEVRLPTDAFQQSTKKVQEIVGTVQGIKVKVIDTPGLFSSSSDQCRNEKTLRSVKRFISKNPPDIVLYCDRLDMQSRDYGDVPLLRTITDIFGASIWFNAIVVLTHAASAPPDGPTGSPLSYEMFVTQRSHVVQQAIRQAAGDVRLMNPVSLVENHSACRMNRAGQRVLPNGQVWKPQLLLLSFASKILAEANLLLKLQDSPTGRPSGARPRVPPLPYLLSSLLQSRPQLKLPEDQSGEDDNLDESLDDTSDSDEGSDYEDLPPFKPLSKSQIEKLSKAQKKAYFEELEYREKLFYKKQLKDDKQRRKYMKKMADMAKDLPDDPTDENLEDDSSAPASVPVPMPDFVLPNSFDSDNPSYRYRFLDSSSQWLVRPVLDSQGWDHDVGYEGLNVERVFVIKEKIPVSVSGQLTKDKKDCAVQMELASSIKHGENKSSSLGLDMQTVGKDIAYTVRGESRFTNFRRNNTAAGVSVTVLGDTVSAGLKIEDKLIVNKRFKVLMSGGAMTGRGEVAYGGRLEATLRDKDYPIGRFLSTIALSVVDWHGELALGCNLQSQLPVGRGSNVVIHSNLSNKGTGQVGVRLNSSEHLQLALVALFPIFKNVMRMFSSSQAM